MTDLAKIVLMALMQDKPYPYESKFLAECKAEGRVQGFRSGLMALIESKELEPTADQFLRIEACEDPEQLRSWIRRAPFAKTIDDIFA